MKVDDETRTVLNSDYTIGATVRSRRPLRSVSRSRRAETETPQFAELVVTKSPTAKIDDDTPVWGAREIGRVIGKNRNATYHLLYTGALGDAVRKVNGLWCGRPSKLREAVS